MVAAVHSPPQLPPPELLKQPAAPSITSRTSKHRLAASAEVVANIMQSLTHRSPALNGCVMAASALNQSNPQLQSLAKELPAISLQVLKPATCTGSSFYAKEMALLASHVQTGLQARVAPVPIDNCTGGVYYLRTKNRRLTGVFKPADEEAYAPNNPKQYLKPESSGVSSMREGISAGDAAVREVAAYLLDHQHFARVPVTMLASIYHPDFHFKASEPPHGKTGALQAYVAHRDTADDVGSGLFNVAEVHAISILDIRLANQDRHGGNLLVVEPAQVVTQTSTSVVTKSLAGKKVSLVPIDHGACLPRISALSETSFMWLLWPQSKQPFSQPAREYIAALDAHHDLKLLEDNLPADFQFEREAILTLFVCTALLKFCALDRHMTAYDIGMLMCRQGTAAQQDVNPSVLETLVASSLRDPAVLKSEALLKKMTSSDKKSSQDKAWMSYVAIFMATFRRELVAHLASTK
ncbi:hypothetical protein PC129_g10048 [Phytophthora cactorum]|uniref:PI3K/PI4K catalytic domain-containing protein n=1 Tax=Phytophthora cactorum TaxID=29920 RepID=A0A329T2M2_9STRA|nr:hypothetical protein Pcac1_g17570 [Phytophthora cactorum]KAG2845249.1 hypothetical protein PC112_g1946 [Phytophthora cactorum]KAG2846138.1 hypothetical protein PC111_g1354 [Phytophthora cactorum]KAG2867283.1 hypothetical protein PC113_g2122 [Phytophthora cactorum]KAG2930766.1 hypothetical protein PC114_g2407 [Phytophthora cactorum]